MFLDKIELEPGTWQPAEGGDGPGYWAEALTNFTFLLKTNLNEILVIVLGVLLIVGAFMSTKDKLFRSFLVAGMIGLGSGLIGGSLGFYKLNPFLLGFGVFLCVFTVISYEKIFREKQ